MKQFKLIFVLLTMVGLMTTSCSNDTTETLTELKTYKTSSTEQHPNQVQKIAKKIAKDPVFITFYKRLLNFSELPKNRNLIRYFGKKVNFKELNKEEQSALLDALGFLNRKEAYNFDYKNQSDLRKIFSKYKFHELSTNELTSVFRLVFPPKDEPPLHAVKSCESRFESCENSAYTLYALEIIGCGVAAGSTGTATFWCGGCLGYVVGSLCVSAAAVSLNSSLNQCQWSYEDCK